LRAAPLRLALAGLHGTVDAGGASLSWLGPIQYTDIEFRDSHGELLLAIPKIESEKSLLGILKNLNDLGMFRIERPQVSLLVRADGSNVEDVVSNGSTSSTSLTSTPSAAGATVKLPALAIEIVDGSIKVADTTSGQQCVVDKLNVKLRTSADSTLPAEFA